MLILGDKEVENGKLAVRLRNGETVNDIDVEEFIQRADEIKSRSINGYWLQ